MTAPKEREEIQRWEWERSLCDDECVAEMAHCATGDYVLHSDHLRHLKLAQIEVLEEMLTHFCGRDAFIHGEENWIFNKIAALRKEL